jgi:tetratricopeptide (TPR) repeat protein
MRARQIYNVEQRQIIMKHRYIILLLTLLLVGCVVVQNDPRLRSIDQVPMYGGMDRQSVPELKKADEAFIESVSSAFGGRERAAKRWVDQAFAFYNHGDLDMAMKRFNQAWLLDPKNPEVYWGFGAVLHDRGLAFGAYDMEMRAYKLGFREVSFLADLGRVSALRVVADASDAKELSQKQRTAYIAESEGYYEEAIKGGEKLGYIYDSWSSARFWAGDYPGAWEKLKIAKAHGAGANERFLTMLSQKMPEPK